MKRKNQRPIQVEGNVKDDVMSVNLKNSWRLLHFSPVVTSNFEITLHYWMKHGTYHNHVIGDGHYMKMQTHKNA